MTNTPSADIESFLQKDSTKSFLKIAEQFIILIENDNITNDEFYKKAHTILINLYAAGHNLEIIELKYSSLDSNYGKIDVDFFKIKNHTILLALGEAAFYWEVFDPTYSEHDGLPGQGWHLADKEPTQHWLVNDFADIYRDLKTEIEKIKIGTDEAIEDALWQMKFSSRNHWGQHCINAVRALHFLWYGGKNTL